MIFLNKLEFLEILSKNLCLILDIKFKYYIINVYKGL